MHFLSVAKHGDMMATIGKLFGKSPFGPLQEHMVIVKECVDQIIPFFEAVIKEDKNSVKSIAENIFSLEDKADDIKNDLRDHLPRTLFMPVDRNNLLEILDDQDSIADTAQDISTLFTLRPITIPEAVKNDLRAFVDSSVMVCHMAAEISVRFDKLLDSSFLGAEAESVLGLIKELNNLERDNDEAGLKLAKQIFSIEKDLQPGDVFLWFKLNGLIGDLADYSQKMANRMRLVIAK